MVILMTLFFIKDRTVVPLLVKTIKNYRNFVAKNLKDQCGGRNIKQKMGKNRTDKFIYILKSNILGFNTLFVLIF